MEWVSQGLDVDTWSAFMQNALQGIEFDYFPDKDQPGYTTFTLESTDWRAEYKARGEYTFRVLFRKVVS